ncbi:MAG: transposase [Nitrososphaerota archaeon]
MLGNVKRLTVKREADEWYAIFITEREVPHKMQIKEIPLERVRSADLGLEKFATFDDSTSIAYPAFLRLSEKKIRHLQRWFSHKHNGSRRSRELGKRLAKLHLHVNRQREDFQNKLINKIFKENDALILERLNTSAMLHNHSIAKSISDASWGKFARKAIFKAESLGKQVIFLDLWHYTVLPQMPPLGTEGPL